MFRAGTPPRSFGGRRGGHRRCCKRPASVHVISVHGCSRFYIIRCKHNSLRDFIAVGDFWGWAMMMPCHISGVRWTVRKSFICVCVCFFCCWIVQMLYLPAQLSVPKEHPRPYLTDLRDAQRGGSLKMRNTGESKKNTSFTADGGQCADTARTFQPTFTNRACVNIISSHPPPKKTRALCRAHSSLTWCDHKYDEHFKCI